MRPLLGREAVQTSLFLLLLAVDSWCLPSLDICWSALVDVSVTSAKSRDDDDAAATATSPRDELLISLPAQYSDDSPHSSIAGHLVHVLGSEVNGSRRRTGCDDYHPSLSIPPGPWVALVQRGDCEFAQKIETAAIARGATALIIYNEVHHPMTGIRSLGYNITVVQMSAEHAAQLLTKMADDGRSASVTIRKDRSEFGNHLDPLTIGVTAIATTAALSLNSIALFGILIKKEKLKPHQYLVVNLIATDWLIGLLSLLQVNLRYEGLREPCVKAPGSVEVECSAAILSRLWNVFMYSNMFTLLFITMEHFFACRWPFHHKVILTRGKVLLCLLVCWIVSATPDAVIFAMECDDMSLSNQSFCEYMLEYSSGRESWEISAVIVSIVTVVLATLVAVYAYILCLVHKMSINVIEVKKKRNAVITSLLLVFSFMLSYSFFYCLHFNVALEHSPEATFIKGQRKLWQALSPTAQLLGDYVIAGVVSAILDPIIYCTRTKKLKAALLGYLRKNFEKRKRSITYGSGKEAQSASTDYTAVTAAHNEEDSL